VVRLYVELEIITFVSTLLHQMSASLHTGRIAASQL